MKVWYDKKASNRGIQKLPPNEVKTYLDKNKVETLSSAATLADNYTLTHQKVFVNSHPSAK